MALAQPIGPPHRQRFSKSSAEGPAGRRRGDTDEKCGKRLQGLRGGAPLLRSYK